jgi:hypothetical protein
MKKRVLIDTSSAILLYKTGWMAALMESYQVVTGPAAFREMTVAHYPGAEAFARWHREKRLALQSPPTVPGLPGGHPRLDPGERECIGLYYAGAGAFIVIDDGPGAAFCRRQAIPYVNALLMPRLLKPDLASRGSAVDAHIQKIFRIGRYAPWVLEYALTCPAENLRFFRP